MSALGAPTPSTISRRRVLHSAAWSAPVVALAAAAPAQAASPPSSTFAIEFDGGGGINGFLNSAYLNLMTLPSVEEITLEAPLTITVDVIGLSKLARDERDFTAGSSGNRIQRAAYNPDTYTTRLQWMIPAGTRVTNRSQSSRNPQILFSFRDGASKTDGADRITNKIVVRSITGGRIVAPGPLPLDSSVVKDVRTDKRSGDGIY